MAGPSADRITEWEGGSLSELVAMLQAAALPVRIEVIAPGATDSSSGEVHLLAGGWPMPSRAACAGTTPWRPCNAWRAHAM
jgi:hypothetical protein